MQAVILAAGLGTRMGELTKDTPKPLLKYQGKSLLEHNLLALPEEVDEVIIVVGYLQEQIRVAIGDFFSGKKIIYVEQKDPQGTAHAVSLCKDKILGPFIVLMGDDLYSAEDLKRLVESKCDTAVMVYEIAKDDANNRHAQVVIYENVITEIKERQPVKAAMLVNVGAYKLNKDFFDYELERAENLTDEYGLPQTLVKMKDKYKIRAVKAGTWTKITSPEDLK